MLSVDDSALLFQIQEVRARNNEHWMGIVRLALTHAPDETRRLLAAIKAGDERVTALTGEVATRMPQHE